MSLSTLAIAVLSLTTPDVCSTAREYAETIAQARDVGVPLVTALTIVGDNPLWTHITATIYTNPNVPPVAVGVMVEGVCRDRT